MEHEPQAPLHHAEDDTSPEAIAERVRNLYGIEKTGVEELIELAGDETQGERFQALLDDLTYEALAENPEFAQNRKDMLSGKLSDSAKTEVRDKQRSLFDRYKQSIIQEAGLPTETGLTDFEKSKQKIQSILNENINFEGGSQPSLVLENLGIITRDDEGREVFTYPRELFPKSTDSKWDAYLESVRNHLRIERAVSHGTIDKTELGEADSTRRMAHNAVAKDVHEILGLDQIEGSKWDLEKTRNLLAKMRDSRFPTVKTSEKFVTEDAVIEGTIGLHALKALRTRLSDLHK